MKPVENVSIGGYVFSLEDDALVVAREYLDELFGFYSKKESGAEVMEGIEERLSELLLEQKGDGGVVTLSMVESAIGTLGRPEAIEEESQGDPDADGLAGSGAGASEAGKESKVKKKLYRDPSQGKVAGVCGGLGTFFGVDPTMFRLLFTVLTLIRAGCFFSDGDLEFGYYCVPLFYAILWICMILCHPLDLHAGGQDCPPEG